MRLFSLFVGAAVLTACSTEVPENNPLIFGQNVTLGVSATPAVETPGVAEFAVGYNQTNTAIVPTQVPGDIPLSEIGANANDQTRKILAFGKDNENEVDALSVFGSFSSDSSVNNAKIGVFFATGVAAQNLSEQVGGSGSSSNN